MIYSIWKLTLRRLMYRMGDDQKTKSVCVSILKILTVNMSYFKIPMMEKKD